MEIIGLTLFGIITFYFIFLIVKGLINEKKHTEKILTTHTVKLKEVVQPKEEVIESLNKNEIDVQVQSVEITEKPAPKKRSKKISKKVE